MSSSRFQRNPCHEKNLKWRRTDPIIFEIQCLIGQLSCKLKNNLIPQENREEAIILAVHLWEELTKQELYSSEFSTDSTQIWKKSQLS